MKKFFARSEYFGAQVLLFEKDGNGFFVSLSFAISCCSVYSELLFVGYCTPPCRRRQKQSITSRVNGCFSSPSSGRTVVDRIPRRCIELTEMETTRDSTLCYPTFVDLPQRLGAEKVFRQTSFVTHSEKILVLCNCFKPNTMGMLNALHPNERFPTDRHHRRLLTRPK